MIIDWREIKYTFRILRKHSLVSGLAVLSIAFGVSVNSAFFGLINAVILRPIPVPHPEELVRVSTISPSGRVGDDRLLLSMFQILHDHNAVFSSLVAWNDDALRNMQAGSIRFLGEVDEVSGDFFATFEDRPLIGRWINNGDVDLASGNSAQVAVLSYRCWSEHYHADPHVLGKTIIVDDIPLTIIGVAKQSFQEVDIDVTSDAIVPIAFSHHEPKGTGYNVTGRMKSGVTLTQAQSDMATLWPFILASTVPATMKPDARDRFLARKIQVTSQSRGDSSLRERYSRPLILLMSLAALVLLITCANLASIMLAHTIYRRSEFQTRLSLGADRWNIIRLILLEALLLSSAGSALGTIWAFWLSRFLVDLFWIGFVPPGVHMTLDIRVLLFMLSSALVTAILFGLLPALQGAVVGSSSHVSQYNSPIPVGRFRAGKALIVTQVVFAFTLVTAAILFSSALYRLRSVDLGYDRRNVLVMTLFKQSRQSRVTNTANYYMQLSSDLQRLPGVECVTFSQSAPALNLEAASPVSSANTTVHALFDSVAPTFFHLLRVPLLEGREFGWQDTETAPRVAILSAGLASRLFPNEDPIGKKVDFGESASSKGLTVIGIVPDANFWKPQANHPLSIYIPLLQVCSGCSPLALIRTTADPLSIAQASERMVWAMGYQYSVRTQTLDQKFEKMLTIERLSSWLSGAFGGVALLLASLGLYGLISYIIELRYAEIGVRLALGATPRRVLKLLLYDALSLVFMGLLIGVPAEWMVSHFLASKFTNVTAHVFSGMFYAAVILLAVSFPAAYLPALRASRINPVDALRSE